MASTTYSEKLRDPRWQKMRLEIMNRDKFTCQFCNATDKTLNVHHIKYIKGRNPWEYAPHFLITLCQDCHEKEGTILKSCKEDLLDQIYNAPLHSSHSSSLSLILYECYNDYDTLTYLANVLLMLKRSGVKELFAELKEKEAANG